MKVTPNIVSARVVKMVNSKSLSFTLKRTSAPSWTTNPVTLCFFQRISPVYSFQSEQTLSICRHTQTPLTHLFLHHRITTTFRYAVLLLHRWAKYSTQLRTPVNHSFTLKSDTVVHQHFLLFLFALAFHSSAVPSSSPCHVQPFCSFSSKMSNQFTDRCQLSPHELQ